VSVVVRGRRVREIESVRNGEGLGLAAGSINGSQYNLQRVVPACLGRKWREGWEDRETSAE